MKETLQNIESFYARKRTLTGGKFLRISFIMTAECNFRCTYCYEDKLNEKLNPDSAIYFLDKAMDTKNNVQYFGGENNPFSQDNKTFLQFDFFGGECLLEVESIDKICQHYIDKCNEIQDDAERNERLANFDIIIQTNGSLLRKKECVKFFKKWRSYFKYVFVTIDGCKEQHDSCRLFKDTKRPTWNIVKNNILWFRKTFPDIQITTKGTICPENVKWISKSFDVYRQLGFGAVPSTIAVGAKKWDKEALTTLRREYDKIIQKQLKIDETKFLWSRLKNTDYKTDYFSFNLHCMGTCGVNGASVAITPRDEIISCSQFSFLTQNGKSIKIGDIYTGITKEGMEFLNKLKHSYPKKLYTDEHCKICMYKTGCDQCPAMALKNFGGLNDDPQPSCEATKIERLASYKYEYLKEKQLWEQIQKEDQ